MSSLGRLGRGDDIMGTMSVFSPMTQLCMSRKCRYCWSCSKCMNYWICSKFLGKTAHCPKAKWEKQRQHRETTQAKPNCKTGEFYPLPSLKQTKKCECTRVPIFIPPETGKHKISSSSVLSRYFVQIDTLQCFPCCPVITFLASGFPFM